MSQTFGTSFVIVSDVQQVLNPAVFGGGPYVHLATVVKGLKEYCAFKHINSNRMYIEEVDPTDRNLFVRIKDDKEWADLYHFLKDAGVLELSKEIKVGQAGLPGLIRSN